MFIRLIRSIAIVLIRFIALIRLIELFPHHDFVYCERQQVGRYDYRIYSIQNLITVIIIAKESKLLFYLPQKTVELIE